jgi:hypothetical protein
MGGEVVFNKLKAVGKRIPLLMVSIPQNIFVYLLT